MKEQTIIKNTEVFVKKELFEAEAGHDWWHIERVRKVALTIGNKEGADLFIVELGALLHDIADSKFHDGDENIGLHKARQFLQHQEVDPEVIAHLVKIMENISYRKSFDGSDFSSLELKVLQDADRLDAIGAIGIARAFSYGGHKQRIFYDPEIKPEKFKDSNAYKSSTAPTINHFYEKLLLLKDKMHTEAAKKLATRRHQFMETYLEEFYREWHGNA